MEKLPKFLRAVSFQTKRTVIETNYGPSFIGARVVKCIGLNEAQKSPTKKSKIDFLDNNDYKIDNYSLFFPKIPA